MDEKVWLAIKFITEYCPVIGSFRRDERLSGFLNELSNDMERYNCGISGFDNFRHKPHVAYAVRAIANFPVFDYSKSVLASVFLATRFETYFRVLSSRLNDDGTWLDANAQKTAFDLIKDKRVKNKQINDVALTYKILMLDRGNKIVTFLEHLEAKLSSYYFDKQGNPFSCSDIGSRIKVLRDPGSHGFYADLSSEGCFYALLLGVLFYGTVHVAEGSAYEVERSVQRNSKQKNLTFYAATDFLSIKHP